MSQLTTELVLEIGRRTVKRCPRCTEEIRDLRHAAQQVRRKAIAIRTREKATCFGASADMVWKRHWKWFAYYERALAACDRAVCPHETRVLDLTPRKPIPVRGADPELGWDGFTADPKRMQDSALSDLIDLQDDAFAWRPLGYDLIADLTEHSEQSSAFEKVADDAAVDRVWFEDLDEKDWDHIHRHHDGEPRWYVETEDRYAAKHFLEKWMQGDVGRDPRDHFGRDHIASLRRRHQSAQFVADLMERWKRHPHQVDEWPVVKWNDGVAHVQLETYRLGFDEWVEQWAPDAIAEFEHQFVPKDRPRPPLLRLVHPSVARDQGAVQRKAAILRVYTDEQLSDLEVAILRLHAKAEFYRRFAEWPEEVYVNTNWHPPAVVEGRASDLPDELLELPEFVEDSIDYEEAVIA